MFNDEGKTEKIGNATKGPHSVPSGTGPFNPSVDLGNAKSDPGQPKMTGEGLNGQADSSIVP